MAGLTIDKEINESRREFLTIDADKYKSNTQLINALKKALKNTLHDLYVKDIELQLKNEEVNRMNIIMEKQTNEIKLLTETLTKKNLGSSF